MRPMNLLFIFTVSRTTVLTAALTAALTAGLTIGTTGCKKKEIFPVLGDQVSSPIDVAVDASESYFYALNSDFPRDYNQGSLLVLTTEGVKVTAIPLPRLGSSLTVAGNTLIVTISQSDSSSQQVLLFDITDPKAPVLAKTFVPSDCNPINAVAKASYNYWVVSCSNGYIFAGDLASPLSDSTLNHVRSYPSPRRALHLDTARNLLIAFPTNLGSQSWGDAQLEDTKSYYDTALDPALDQANIPKETSDKSGTITEVPNQIPDDQEKTGISRANKNSRGMYQFAVLDLEKSHGENWKKIDPVSTKEAPVSSAFELHWIYFGLSNFDGTPDLAQTAASLTTHYYRTNFWEAKPDPQDGDVFYVSQRGSADPRYGGSLHANSIIKVRITGDLTSNTLATSETLSFERVYGFKGELDSSGRHFPGDFEIATVQGKPLLVVNHFRDLVNWPKEPFFSIAAKIIGENRWFTENTSTSSLKSYHQLALTSSGRAIATNFYGNSLIVLDVTPGVGIIEKTSQIK
jgi:hypothetical protein